MRIAPELSLSRVNQAGWDGPLLLSEPISKNEAKMTLRRRKWGIFYRKGYVARYGATPLLLSCCDDFLQNGLSRRNVVTLCHLICCVKTRFLKFPKTPKNVAKRSNFTNVKQAHFPGRSRSGWGRAREPPARQRRVSRRHCSGVDISHPEL